MVQSWSRNTLKFRGNKNLVLHSAVVEYSPFVRKAIIKKLFKKIIREKDHLKNVKVDWTRQERVQSTPFRVQGLGFRVQCLWLTFYGLRSRVQGAGLRVWYLGYRV